mmetsp:Transcript_17918/g.42523  ORF Transcript_17918/g.42523 Transcript_17918/m.42523 type:complete len:239 (+) Transcript_17918:406-1122(+)
MQATPCTVPALCILATMAARPRCSSPRRSGSATHIAWIFWIPSTSTRPTSSSGVGGGCTIDRRAVERELWSPSISPSTEAARPGTPRCGVASCDAGIACCCCSCITTCCCSCIICPGGGPALCHAAASCGNAKAAGAKAEVEAAEVAAVAACPVEALGAEGATRGAGAIRPLPNSRSAAHCSTENSPFHGFALGCRIPSRKSPSAYTWRFAGTDVGARSKLRFMTLVESRIFHSPLGP